MKSQNKTMHPDGGKGWANFSKNEFFLGIHKAFLFEYLNRINDAEKFEKVKIPEKSDSFMPKPVATALAIRARPFGPTSSNNFSRLAI